jgi:hypothetical protein
VLDDVSKRLVYVVSRGTECRGNPPLSIYLGLPCCLALSRTHAAEALESKCGSNFAKSWGRGALLFAVGMVGRRSWGPSQRVLFDSVIEHHRLMLTSSGNLDNNAFVHSCTYRTFTYKIPPP